MAAPENPLPGLKDLFPEHFFQNPDLITALPQPQNIPAPPPSASAPYPQQQQRARYQQQLRPDTSRNMASKPRHGHGHGHEHYVFASDMALMEEEGMDDEGFDGDDADLAEKRRHPCPRCGKRFNRPSSLKIHLNTHTGAKPFECPFPGCGRTFNVSSNMRRHYRNHSRRPPPPPIPTNAYPILGPPGQQGQHPLPHQTQHQGGPGRAAWPDVREQYRYPHPYPPSPSPPTPPYTNESPSPRSGMGQGLAQPGLPEHGYPPWEGGEMDEYSGDYSYGGEGEYAVGEEDAYGSEGECEEYHDGNGRPMAVQELGPGGRGPKGLKWKRDNNWLQFRSILVPVNEAGHPSPDTPSLRSLYPPNNLEHPQYPHHPHSLHQHPQSHVRRVSSASSISHSSSSGSSSRSHSRQSAVRTYPHPPSAAYPLYAPTEAPEGSAPYPCYTYPPPMPVSAPLAVPGELGPKPAYRCSDSRSSSKAYDGQDNGVNAGSRSASIGYSMSPSPAPGPPPDQLWAAAPAGPAPRAPSPVVDPSLL